MTLDLLLAPLRYEFFVRSLVAATLVGGLCGLIGVYVVLRRMSYIGHGLSHAIFGGAVVSYVLNWNFYLGAGLWGILSALLINQTARRRKIGADAAIGIVTTASFAVGVAIISHLRRFTQNFEAALFGNVLGVTPQDVLAIAGVALLVGGLVFFSYRQLLFSTFDPEVAATYGVRVEWFDTLFALALAATVIVSMQVMGVTMIAAAIVVPAATARLLSDRFAHMLLLATALGAFCGGAGLLLSFYLDISSGATVVLTAAAVFLLAYTSTALRRELALRRGAAPRPAPLAAPQARDLYD